MKKFPNWWLSLSKKQRAQYKKSKPKSRIANQPGAMNVGLKKSDPFSNKMDKTKAKLSNKSTNKSNIKTTSKNANTKNKSKSIKKKASKFNYKLKPETVKKVFKTAVVGTLLGAGYKLLEEKFPMASDETKKVIADAFSSVYSGDIANKVKNGSTNDLWSAVKSVFNEKADTIGKALDVDRGLRLPDKDYADFNRAVSNEELALTDKNPLRPLGRAIKKAVTSDEFKDSLKDAGAKIKAGAETGAKSLLKGIYDVGKLGGSIIADPTQARTAIQNTENAVVEGARKLGNYNPIQDLADKIKSGSQSLNTGISNTGRSLKDDILNRVNSIDNYMENENLVPIKPKLKPIQDAIKESLLNKNYADSVQT